VDVMKADHMPVTTVARTIIDLAGVLPADAVEENLDFVLAHGHVPELSGALRGASGGPARMAGAGVCGKGQAGDAGRTGAARRPASRCQGPRQHPRNQLGRILSSLRPVWGYVVIIEGRAYVLDCAFLDVLLAVEADGWASHCGRLQWEDDIAWQNALVRAGWTVLRYPWSVIVNRPQHVEQELVETRARLSAGR
jgi:hypothetical protein